MNGFALEVELKLLCNGLLLKSSLLKPAHVHLELLTNLFVR